MSEKLAYQIYGRTSYETPLAFIAEVEVDTSVTDEVLAEVGNEGWIELVAIPTKAMLHVVGEEEDDD
ncbi:MAG: hypothetical protein KC423_25605 [Anaerolineales bacterium]|nr:hypothetical protein [Anaerolineales bacterium]